MDGLANRCDANYATVPESPTGIAPAFLGSRPNGLSIELRGQGALGESRTLNRHFRRVLCCPLHHESKAGHARVELAVSALEAGGFPLTEWPSVEPAGFEPDLLGASKLLSRIELWPQRCMK